MKRYQQVERALGGEAVLTLISDDPQRVGALFSELWLSVLRFERQFSRFLPDSELSRLNQESGKRFRVSSPMHRLLQAAKDMATEMEGLYNPFILPALTRSGYVKSYSNPNDPVETYADRQVVEPDRLELGKGWARIPKEAALDLGGCGKGYLLDQLADQIEGNVAGFAFSLSGDVIVGGNDLEGEPWRIAVEDGREANANRAFFLVPAGQRYAMATSGIQRRKGVYKGVAWHHLIDTRTLRPATTDVLTATVTAAQGLRADILASSAVLLGTQKAEPFVRAHGGTALLLQHQDESGTSGFGSIVVVK